MTPEKVIHIHVSFTYEGTPIHSLSSIPSNKLNIIFYHLEDDFISYVFYTKTKQIFAFLQENLDHPNSLLHFQNNFGNTIDNIRYHKQETSLSYITFTISYPSFYYLNKKNNTRIYFNTHSDINSLK